MAKTYKITEAATVTIKNVAEAEVLENAYTGERKEMLLPAAKAAHYTEFEYVLDADGNFVVAEDKGGKLVAKDEAPAADGSNVVVIVRQAVKLTDRFVQFYRTQQKIKLAKDDSIEIAIKSAAEAAYYLQYADDKDFAVTSTGVVTEA